MKNLLFISIAFPPKLDPECIQTTKYFKYMAFQKNRYNIDVVTSSNPTLFMPVDASMPTFKASIRQAINIKIVENKYINYVLRKLGLSYLLFPDSKHSFYRQWKKVVNQLDHTPDLIYSRSFPLSSTIMAYKLTTHYNVPWILHLSDPWADSPLHTYSTKELAQHNYWEKKCFNQATYITFTSQGTIELYKNKYPQLTSKFKLFPNVYDKEEQLARTQQPINKLRFVYTGGLAGNRTAEPILKALKLITQTDPNILNNCEFIFAGDMDKKNKNIFARYKQTYIKHLGQLSYQKSTELQWSAHVLIILDSPIADSSKSIFFPSKLLDYLTTGNRMLAITTAHSTTDKFITKHKLGTTIAHHNINAIKTHVLLCLIEFNRENMPFFKKETNIEEYSAQYNANRLLNLFDEAL